MMGKGLVAGLHVHDVVAASRPSWSKVDGSAVGAVLVLTGKSGRTLVLTGVIDLFKVRLGHGFGLKVQAFVRMRLFAVAVLSEHRSS